MTTYEQISKKYADAVSERRRAITNAGNKVVIIEAKIDAWRQIQEQYRQRGSTIIPENASEWNRIATRISRYNEELRKAKLALSLAEIGAQGEQAIDAMIEKVERNV